VSSPAVFSHALTHSVPSAPRTGRIAVFAPSAGGKQDAIVQPTPRQRLPSTRIQCASNPHARCRTLVLWARLRKAAAPAACWRGQVGERAGPIRRAAAALHPRLSPAMVLGRCEPARGGIRALGRVENCRRSGHNACGTEHSTADFHIYRPLHIHRILFECRGAARAQGRLCFPGARFARDYTIRTCSVFS
jgi:hypothetical protein